MTRQASDAGPVPTTDEDDIRALEAARCAAIVAGDRHALAVLIADDLVHVHGTGHVDDKAGYLAGIGGKYRFQRVERGALDIRMYDGFCVVVGTLHQSYVELSTGRVHHVDGITSQTWMRQRDDGWRQNCCHNSFLSQR